MDDTIAHLIVVALAAGAAITDWRTGKIPNWLTLPPLVAAPVAYLLLGGVPALAASVLGMLVCGLPPYLLFRKEAIGGGDVKLLAAIGAVAGLTLGLEGQLFGFVIAALYAIVKLAWQRKLLIMLSNSVRLLVNPVLPKRYKRPIDPQEMTSIRLGAFILAGVIMAVLGQHQVIWG